jgi:hypothetical protein
MFLLGSNYQVTIHLIKLVNARSNIMLDPKTLSLHKTCESFFILLLLTFYQIQNETLVSGAQ